MPATIFAQFAKKSPAPMVIDWPDRDQDCQKSAVGISGPAQIAETPQKCAGLVLMLVKLEELLSQQRLAWKKRQIKKAYSIEAAIRAQRLAIWGGGACAPQKLT